jgi:hypothetical protein
MSTPVKGKYQWSRSLSQLLSYFKAIYDEVLGNIGHRRLKG